MLALVIGFLPSLTLLSVWAIGAAFHIPDRQGRLLLWAVCCLSCACCFIASFMLFRRRTTLAIIGVVILLLLNAFIAFFSGCLASLEF